MPRNNHQTINRNQGPKLRRETISVDRLAVKRLGIFADPEAFVISLPEMVGRDYQSFGAKILSLDEIRRIARLTSDNNPIARIRTLHKMAEYIELNASQPIAEPNSIISGISAKPKTRRSGFAFVSLDLDHVTAEIIRAERTKFIKHFDGEKLVQTAPDYIVTFARLGFADDGKASNAYNNLLDSRVVGQAVILRPAIAEYPITEL